MKGRRFTSRDRILIGMELIETDIKMADLCRKYNFNLGTFSKWKTRFMDGGKKQSLGGCRIGSGTSAR